MSVNPVSRKNVSPRICYMPAIDSEEKAIMDKLISYGYTPTGNKSSDKALLHKIELEKAREEVNSSPVDSVSSDKFLTVSQSEIESMSDKKKERLKDINPEKAENNGAEIVASYNQFIINQKRFRPEDKIQDKKLKREDDIRL